MPLWKLKLLPKLLAKEDCPVCLLKVSGRSFDCGHREFYERPSNIWYVLIETDDGHSPVVNWQGESQNLNDMFTLQEILQIEYPYGTFFITVEKREKDDSQDSETADRE